MSATPTRSGQLEKTVRRRGGQLGWMWSMVRGLGALALLAVGAVHLQQYHTLYAAVPTIGPLFVVNFAAATILGILLLAISESRPLFGFRELGYDPGRDRRLARCRGR